MSDAIADLGVVYLDGQFLPAAQARVSPFDRGYLFGDGVYEVVTVIDGKLVDVPGHMARLDRSLSALSLPRPLDDDGLLAMMRELVQRNAVVEGKLYFQITRGVAARSFDWPAAPKAVLFAFLENRPVLDTAAAENGVSIAFVEDRRWKRRDIKTINLLPASWAKAEAAAKGADDAWMVEPGPDGKEYVTEGSSNNAFIVNEAGEIVTRGLSNAILHGVTRAAIAALCAETGQPFIERPFTPEEALSAREAFVTSASAMVSPIVKIEGTTIGDGAPGPITKRMRALYIEAARANAI